MTQISAWEAHKQAQAEKIVDREIRRKQRAEANKEYEAELRRRCAVQAYQSPFSALAKTVREALDHE